VWPRLTLGARAFWRDLHAVTGFWVAGLALVLLLTGLPWADAWGRGFLAVRQEMGWMRGPVDWTVGGKPVDAGHDHAAMMVGMPDMPGMMAHEDTGPLDLMVGRARGRSSAFPCWSCRRACLRVRGQRAACG
jgi:uncharacterized iron-regulated membrane protein